MKTQNDIPKPLSPSEEKEMKELSVKIFNGAMFLVVSEEDRKQPHVQRYEQLMLKKMEYLSYLNRASILN